MHYGVHPGDFIWHVHLPSRGITKAGSEETGALWAIHTWMLVPGSADIHVYAITVL